MCFQSYLFYSQVLLDLSDWFLLSQKLCFWQQKSRKVGRARNIQEQGTSNIKSTRTLTLATHLGHIRSIVFSECLSRLSHLHSQSEQRHRSEWKSHSCKLLFHFYGSFQSISVTRKCLRSLTPGTGINYHYISFFLLWSHEVGFLA